VHPSHSERAGKERPNASLSSSNMNLEVRRPVGLLEAQRCKEPVLACHPGNLLDFSAWCPSNEVAARCRNETPTSGSPSVSTVSHIVAFLQFTASFATSGFPARWYVQFGLLVAGSLACAVMQFVLHRRDIAQALLVLLRLPFPVRSQPIPWATP